MVTGAPATDARGSTPDVPTFRLFLAGEWVEGVSGRTFESVNPADRRDVTGRFQAGTAADVAMAVKAAEMALCGALSSVESRGRRADALDRRGLCHPPTVGSVQRGATAGGEIAT